METSHLKAQVIHRGSKILNLPPAPGPLPGLNHPTGASNLHPRTWTTSLPPPLLSNLPSSGHRLPALHRPQPTVPKPWRLGPLRCPQELRATQQAAPSESCCQPQAARPMERFLPSPRTILRSMEGQQ